MSTVTLKNTHTFCRNNVSKLERLNTRVSKLLTVAVQEVLEVVRETVCEYQEKTSRTQRENERLRLKLQEALEQLEKEREVSRLASISLSVNSLSTQTQHGPDGPDVSYLHQESSSEEPNLKTEELSQAAEPETVCDFRVAVTLDEMCKEPQNSTQTSHPSPTEHRPITAQDIKTESPLDHSSPQQQVSQAEFEEFAEGLGEPVSGQEAMGTSGYSVLYIQSNLSSPGRHMMSGRNARLALEASGSLLGSGIVERHGCRICGKSFSRVGNLRIHERCHTGEKPYCCPVCGRCFIQAGDLKKHKRVHTGEKPYYCLQCGKSFSRRENLKRHQKIHIGESLHHQRLWRDPE